MSLGVSLQRSISPTDMILPDSVASYPYIKMTGSVYVCLSVQKDLTNNWTDMVLLNNVASYPLKVTVSLSVC